MTQRPAIYLDANATMPVKPAAIDAMTEALRETGNASSIHGAGRTARRHVEDARQAVADMLSTHPAYVFFTGGATESNNTVLGSFRDGKIFVSAIEHPSILEAAPQAERLPVTADGVMDLAVLEQKLAQQPDLISVMLVNNETGVIQPVADIVRLVRRLSPRTRVHTDAAQAAGRIPVDFSALQVDYLSLSAHKMGGPQGAGALVLAPGAAIDPLLRGGGQEKRQRAGTENIPALAGFGVAASLAAQDMADFQSLAALRDRIENTLLAVEPRLRIYGRNAPRVANTTQIALPGIAAETQLMALDLAGIAISSGSACSSGTVRVSHVLRAMGVPDNEAQGALRISLPWNTAKEDIDRLIAAWEEMHARVKNKIAA